METLPPTAMNQNRKPTTQNSTEASHSAIGRSTALDYNLGSMHKNALLIFDTSIPVGPAIAIVDPVLD